MRTRNFDILAVILGITVVLLIIWLVRPANGAANGNGHPVTSSLLRWGPNAHADPYDPTRRWLASSPSTAEPWTAISTAMYSGTASFVAPMYGSDYLALPEGRGITVRVCHEDRCVVRTSNDAGPVPSLERVADLSFQDFTFLCQCHAYSVGLIRVSVERLSPLPTPPETDTAP